MTFAGSIAWRKQPSFSRRGRGVYDAARGAAAKLVLVGASIGSIAYTLAR